MHILKRVRGQNLINDFYDFLCTKTKAWSGGGHHIRTPDGLNYTFNGVGEYALVEHPRLRFQGRMIPGYPGTTHFSAFVVQYDNDRVQVKLVVIYSLASTMKTNYYILVLMLLDEIHDLRVCIYMYKLFILSKSIHHL